MFRFLKTKKGFSLVELMIVVVIMAILVAVAVPIFSAVTKNARTKTCIGNQREIVSSVGNWLMLQTSSTISGSFTTSGGQDTPAWGTIEITGLGNGVDDDAEIKALFKTIPVCPDSAATITATITAGNANSKATVKTKCNGGENSVEHFIPGTTNESTNGAAS